jgi:hypothetical protein
MTAGRFTAALDERGLACEWLVIDMGSPAPAVVARCGNAEIAWHLAAVLSEAYTDGSLPPVFDLRLAPSKEPF